MKIKKDRSSAKKKKITPTDVKYNLDWSFQINLMENKNLLPGRIFKFSVIRFESENK